MMRQDAPLIVLRHAFGWPSFWRRPWCSSPLCIHSGGLFRSCCSKSWFSIPKGRIFFGGAKLYIYIYHNGLIERIWCDLFWLILGFVVPRWMLIQIFYDADVWRDSGHVFQYCDTAGFRSGLWWRSPCDGQRGRESWCGLGQRRFNQAATLVPNFRTFRKQSAFKESLPSRSPPVLTEFNNLQVAEGSRSRNPFQLQFVPAFNSWRVAMQLVTADTQPLGPKKPNESARSIRKLGAVFPRRIPSWLRLGVMCWFIVGKLRIGSQSFAWHLDPHHCNKWIW